MHLVEGMASAVPQEVPKGWASATEVPARIREIIYETSFSQLHVQAALAEGIIRLPVSAGSYWAEHRLALQQVVRKQIFH